MLKYDLEIEISDIEVDDRYFTFNYKVKLNGKEIKSEEINDDYCNGETPEEFKKTLEDGWALQLVIQDLEGEF